MKIPMNLYGFDGGDRNPYNMNDVRRIVVLCLMSQSILGSMLYEEGGKQMNVNFLKRINETFGNHSKQLAPKNKKPFKRKNTYKQRFARHSVGNADH